MFKGERTAVFWVGLAIFGYSLYLFFQAIWLQLYYHFVYPSTATNISSSSIANIAINQKIEFYINFPAIIGGIIFLIIGLYMMKEGVKKQSLPAQSEQTEKTM